ncbi:MAG: dTMP kinase [Thermodesulfobacteria bacterium]|nr:dTMP kinase [Thermodesulfobacteriota bacterium]
MKNQYPGFFLVIEGIDGSGKSTLANNLYLALKKMGKDCLLTFEPTNGKWGAILRQSFTGAERLSANEELGLFMKDRQDHLENVIIPALKDGRIIICDRYYFSTAAYQGARGLDPQAILAESRAKSLEPDLCLFLELSPEEAINRIRHGRKEKENNFEQLDYLKSVAKIYGTVKNGCIPLDATLPIEELTDQALKLILQRLEDKNLN